MWRSVKAEMVQYTGWGSGWTGALPFHFHCLCLYPAVGEEEVQPAAETNEQEGDDTEEQEWEKDPHCLHLAAGVVVEVAVQGDPFTS